MENLVFPSWWLACVPSIQSVPLNTDSSIKEIPHFRDLVVLTCFHVGGCLQSAHFPTDRVSKVAHVKPVHGSFLPISSSYWIVFSKLASLMGLGKNAHSLRDNDLFSRRIWLDDLTIFITRTNNACFMQNPGI